MIANQDLIKANAKIIENDFNWLKNLILYQLGKANDALIERIEKQGEIQPPTIEKILLKMH